MRRLIGGALVLGVLAGACAGPPAEPAQPAHLAPVAPRPPDSGVFTALTYNVHGLPIMVARTTVDRNMPLIGPKLNGFDLVLVQEDFVHHRTLSEAAGHPHRSRPMIHGSGRLLSDGLNRFSRFPFGRLRRVKWVECYGLFKHGSDCLARKGFTFARTRLGPAAEVDVYNLHADAGGHRKDIRARRRGFAQLAGFILEHSKDRAVIVGGDTNLHAHGVDEEVFRRLLDRTGLRDAARSVPNGKESIDRFLYRSGGGVRIRPLDWARAGGFVDPDGRPLSDHSPITVTFEWTSE